MRKAQMEGPEAKTPAKGKVGGFCIFAQSMNAGWPLHGPGLADNPLKAEVFRMIYV